MDIHILNSLQHNHIKFCYFQQQLSQFCSDLVTYVRLVENWPIIVSDPLFEFELVNTVEGTLWSENEMLNTIIRVFQQEVTTNCAVIMLTLSSAEIRRNYLPLKRDERTFEAINRHSFIFYSKYSISAFICIHCNNVS